MGPPNSLVVGLCFAGMRAGRPISVALKGQPVLTLSLGRLTQYYWDTERVHSGRAARGPLPGSHIFFSS